jgi:hypothetical protein
MGTSYAAVPDILGMKLQHARVTILKAGWKPRVTHLKLGDDELEKEHGSTSVFLRAGYREVEICTGTGINSCIFNYVRGTACLKVSTVGEQPRHTVVSSISQECPPSEAL